MLYSDATNSFIESWLDAHPGGVQRDENKKSQAVGKQSSTRDTYVLNTERNQFGLLPGEYRLATKWLPFAVSPNQILRSHLILRVYCGGNSNHQQAPDFSDASPGITPSTRLRTGCDMQQILSSNTSASVRYAVQPTASGHDVPKSD